jgi:hypothetical protein
VVSPNTSLFFQIAAGLIPVLLFAGAINDGLRKRWFETLRLPTRRIVAAGAVVLAAAVILAEFVAIAEAVSSDLYPSRWRAEVVADVLEIETILLAADFLVPWLHGFAGFRRFFREMLTGALTVFLLVVWGAVAGLWLLNESVNKAASRHDAAVFHCVQRASLDQRRETIEAEDLVDRASSRAAKARAVLANLRSRKGDLTPVQFGRELKEAKAAAQEATRKEKAAGEYLGALFTFGTLSDPQDFEEIIAAYTGC